LRNPTIWMNGCVHYLLLIANPTRKFSFGCDWPTATLRSGSVSAKPTLRERKAWPKASASAKSDQPYRNSYV
ncbi:hypothetical protein, partial [Moorena bouillonii]|uniref:hypothetical protein n=1 Tax=Moorena bouillonii TaxID=207920 RepID=UPI001BE0BC56